MGSVCAEQRHNPRKFHRPKARETPPRNLIGPKAERHDSFSSEGAVSKFLPGGGDDSSDSDSESYSSDHFRMFEFKVRRCNRSRSHDWTDCPFAHPGEKARRRDPRKYHYSGAVCVEHRRGTCSRGDNCQFNHGVFEFWLHPSRYRTEACKEGKNCQRKVCFFAHTPRQLRVPVQQDEPPPAMGRKYQAEPVPIPLGNHHCCMSCHSVNRFSSPRSTLLDVSNLWPPLSPSSSLSPPLSPLKNRSLAGFSPASLFTDRFLAYSNTISSNRDGGGGNFSYKDVLNEMMNNFDSVQMNERRIGNCNLAWLDAPNVAADEQPQFLLSPSTPSTSNRFGASNAPNLGKRMDSPRSTDPDIGWVMELLT